jgi:hypothetical protein
MHKANCEIIRKERHEVSEQDIKNYFDAIVLHLQKVLSLFVWNADDTRFGSPKRRNPPEVIVAKDTQPGSVTVNAVNGYLCFRGFNSANVHHK